MSDGTPSCPSPCASTSSVSGATVVVHYHGARAAAREVAGALDGASTVQADLATAEGCRALMQAVRRRHRKLDLLVNNAAEYARSPFAYEEDAAWEKLLALNL